jgi:septal ring factor EnvC (AmiA/AmiB activator)
MQDHTHLERRYRNLRGTHDQQNKTTVAVKKEKEELAVTNSRIETENAEVAAEKLRLVAQVERLKLSEAERKGLEAANSKIMQRLDQMMERIHKLESQLRHFTEPSEDSSACFESDSFQAPKRRKTALK